MGVTGTKLSEHALRLRSERPLFTGLLTSITVIRYLMRGETVGKCGR